MKKGFTIKKRDFHDLIEHSQSWLSNGCWAVRKDSVIPKLKDVIATSESLRSFFGLDVREYDDNIFDKMIPGSALGWDYTGFQYEACSLFTHGNLGVWVSTEIIDMLNNPRTIWGNNNQTPFYLHNMSAVFMPLHGDYIDLIRDVKDGMVTP